MKWCIRNILGSDDVDLLRVLVEEDVCRSYLMYDDVSVKMVVVRMFFRVVECMVCNW